MQLIICHCNGNSCKSIAKKVGATFYFYSPGINADGYIVLHFLSSVRPFVCSSVRP